jgi:HEAT repeat protein
MEALAREGQAVVPPLIEALGHKEAGYWACLVLAEIGPDAAAAVGALARLARSDPRPDVRREAILALAAIGPQAAPAATELTTVIAQDTVNGEAAVYALGAIGPAAKAAEVAVKELAAKADASPLLRLMSLWSLARMNPNDKRVLQQVLPSLFASLKSPEPGLRAAAVRALLGLDPDPEVVRPFVAQLLREGDPKLIEEIVNIVAGLGATAVPQLIEALKYPEIRDQAAGALAKIGPPAGSAVPALSSLLGEQSPGTRSEVLFALASIGPDAKEAVPAVARLLGDPEMEVRYAAAFALGKIGRSAMPAVAELQHGLESPDGFLAMASAWALAWIDPENQATATKSVPVLIDALKAPDLMTRLQAAEALARWGPLARPAAATLRERLQDRDEHVREAAAQALKAIGT